MFLFFNSFSVVLATSMYELKVVDTILGEDTFYSFERWEGSEEYNGDYFLALRKPDLSLVKVKDVDMDSIESLTPYRLDSSLLDVSGNYDLFLLEQGERYSEILLRDGFMVVESVSGESDNFDISKWLGANMFGFGGDEILLAQAEMNRFDVEDLPSVVEVQSPVTFTVQALDEAQEDDVSYTGTIKVEALNDSNAVTPNDYTFVLQDAGRHRFVESLVFNSVGTKTLKITDVDDEDITAEFNVEVVDTDALNDEETLLQIESPTSTVYSENRILVKGTTEPGLEVTVLEGGADFVSFDAGVDGSFTELLPALEDGLYEFQFRVNETLSSVYNVEIRTGGVSIRSFELSKLEVAPVELIDVELELNNNANSASVMLNGVRTDLFKQDVTGTFYTGQITAPVSNGQYPVNIMVVDDVGNPSTLETGVSITVGGEVQEEDDSLLGSGMEITGLQGESLDKRVRLTWNAPAGVNVLFYSIKFGESPTALTSFVDTIGSNPEWFVPNLENEVNYYFQVFAVDQDGNEVAGSDIISVAPGRPDNTSLMGASDVDTTSETGPGLVLLLLFSMSVGLIIRFKNI